MLCEICGRETERTFRVWFEGEEVFACERCIKKLKLERVPKRKKEVAEKRKVGQLLLEGPVLVDNFNEIIRRAREDRGLSQEELARMIGEKTSTIKKIESGKLIPTDRLIRELERVLKIKLTEET